MRAIRRSALVVLVLVSAVVVVAAPAFATPRLTTSTGTRPDNGAVSPFMSPIGDTLTNSITITVRVAAGARSGSSFGVRNLAGGSDSVTCIKATVSSEVVPTHTRIAIYSFDFLGCRTDSAGLRVDIVTNHISSSSPYYLHITTNNGGGSATGVFELPEGSSIDIFIKSGGLDVCQMHAGPQSLRGVTITDGSVTRTRTMSIASGTTIDFSLPRALTTACPDPRARTSETSVTPIAFTFDGPVGNTPIIQTTSRLP